ncbi:O-antigen ligase family protein [Candidatus Omnitrophota bacterium]
MRKLNLTYSSIEDILLIILLLFAPLALASRHTWSYCIVAIISLVIFNLYFLCHPERAKRAEGSSKLLNVLKTPISIGLLAFLLINLLYMIPLPAQIIKLLSPSAYNLRETYMLDPGKWQTLSVYPRATVEYMIKIISYIMVFLVVVSKIFQNPEYRAKSPEQNDHRSLVAGHSSCYSFILLGALSSVLAILFHSLCDFNMHIPANALYFMVILAIVTGLSYRESKQRTINYSFVNKLVNSIIIIGFIIAVFGIIQKLSYNGKIYWLIDIPGGHFGPYINHDHYAGYMGMCTLLAISQLMVKIVDSSLPRIKRLKDKIVWFSSPEANKTLVYLFMAVVMTAALFLTTSRGGIMSFIAALAVFCFMCIIGVSRRKRKRLLLVFILTIVLMIIMILWVGPEETVNRFKVLNKVVRFFIREKAILSELRPHMWKDTFGLVKDFPVFGVGLGNYSYVFPKYRTFIYHARLLRYAHNDYLQLISEMGIFGVMFIAGFFIWYFRRFRECLHRLKEMR